MATPWWKTRWPRYGLDLGMAFQIADDLLDVLGDEATVGKSLGTDLVKQKSTLPLIRVLQQADPAQRPEVVALLSRSGNHRCQALRPWLERFDAVAYAQAKALDYSRLAQEGLRSIPPARRGTPCTSWPASWSPANTRT